MIIALDWDNTYTKDTELWDRFITDASQKGHLVKIVTMRFPSEAVENPPCDVVYTSRKSKASCFKADVWIDDSPHWIFQDSPC